MTHSFALCKVIVQWRPYSQCTSGHVITKYTCIQFSLHPTASVITDIINLLVCAMQWVHCGSLCLACTALVFNQWSAPQQPRVQSVDENVGWSCLDLATLQGGSCPTKASTKAENRTFNVVHMSQTWKYNLSSNSHILSHQVAGQWRQTVTTTVLSFFMISKCVE